MKKSLTILVTVLLVNFSFGQEEKQQDTTKISFKGKMVTITTNDCDRGPEELTNEKKKWSINQWRGFELGVNGLFTSSDFGINNDPSNVHFELDYAKSLNFNLNLFEFNTRIGTEKFRFYTGAGFRFNRYAFKSTNSTLSYNDTTTFSALDSLKSFDKNYLNASYISVPVFFSFMPGKKQHKTFHISAGAIVNYRIGSRIKQKYVLDDQKRKDVNRGHYHLNPFLVDASVRIGVGNFSVYANYGLNSLFESNKGPDYTPFSLGLSLNI